MTIYSYPKPKRPPTPAVRVYPDGRECCTLTKAGAREYQRRTQEMYSRDKGKCCLCGQFIWDSPTFEHLRSRGMGGAFRDDRPEFNGVSHMLGNSAKGSMSFELYMQQPLAERIRLCGGTQ